MHQTQYQCLDHRKQSDINERRQPLFHTVFTKLRPIIVLDESLDNRNGHIPQCDNVESDALVYVCGSMEVMISVHAQLLVVVLDNVINYLRGIFRHYIY